MKIQFKPNISIHTEPSTCACGNRNYKLKDKDNIIYKLYRLAIPSSYAGEYVFIKCDKCLRELEQVLKNRIVRIKREKQLVQDRYL